MPHYLHNYQKGVQVTTCRLGLYFAGSKFFTDDGFGNLVEACIHKACNFAASGMGDQ